MADETDDVEGGERPVPTGLPPGFVPAWEWVRTEDGVIELEHEGGRIAREAMEANDDSD